jgi:hypothetical protein
LTDKSLNRRHARRRAAERLPSVRLLETVPLGVASEGARFARSAMFDRLFRSNI